MKLSICTIVRNRSDLLVDNIPVTDRGPIIPSPEGKKTPIFEGEKIRLNMFQNLLVSLNKLVRENDKWEIIIVDNNSEDVELARVVPTLLTKLNYRLVRVYNPVFSRGELLNIGMKYATGEVILCLDADMLFTSRDVLERGIELGEKGIAYFPICFSYSTPNHEYGWWRRYGKGNVFLPKKIEWWENSNWGQEDDKLYAEIEPKERDRGKGFYHQWHPNVITWKNRYGSDSIKPTRPYFHFVVIDPLIKYNYPNYKIRSDGLRSDDLRPDDIWLDDILVTNPTNDPNLLNLLHNQFRRGTTEVTIGQTKAKFNDKVEIYLENIPEISFERGFNIVVVMITYNCEDIAVESLKSVVHQDYPNFRVIHVDDNSSDSTYFNLVNYVRNQSLTNVKLIHNDERKGACFNRQMGIEMCDDDELVVLVDGDDYFPHNQCLRIIHNEYVRTKCWMTCGEYLIYPAFKNISSATNQRKLYFSPRKYGGWPGMHVRTFFAWLGKSVDRKNLKDEEGNYFQCSTDMALLISMMEMCGDPARFHLINQPLYLYTVVEQTYSPERVASQKKIQDIIYSRTPYYRLEEAPIEINYERDYLKIHKFESCCGPSSEYLKFIH